MAYMQQTASPTAASSKPMRCTYHDNTTIDATPANVTTEAKASG